MKYWLIKDIIFKEMEKMDLEINEEFLERLDLKNLDLRKAMNSHKIDYSKLFIPFSKFIKMENQVKQLKNTLSNSLEKYNEKFKEILESELL